MAYLKAEGFQNGVSDLNLDLPRGRYHFLRIEMKTKTGKQSDAQKEYEKAVFAVGGIYVICRSENEAIDAFRAYMDLGEFNHG